MVHRKVILSILLSLVGRASAAPTEQGQCKSTPGSPDWPSKQDWNQLNQTLKGNLLAPLPPAIVCDPKQSAYSKQACSELNDKWFKASFFDADPISLQMVNWQQDACLPDVAYNKSHDCDLKPFPKYTVKASESQHVVDAVKFAQKHNIRVSVKNTGHDYIGRSTSPEMSIWTHNLKKIDVHDSFQPSNCKNAASHSAITVSGGNQFSEIYQTIKEHNVLVAGGAEPSVGLGGYLTGGGHSPLGSKLGLAIDNVLEMKVVCPSGELVTANECQNSDLFWAMRGGGGSTFGILISATLKTYPNYPGANFTMLFESSEDEATKNNNSNFFGLLADLFEELVGWSDNDINGYMNWGPAAALTALGGGGNPAGSGSSGSSGSSLTGSQPMLLSFGGWINNQSDAKLTELTSAFVKKLNSTNGVQGTFNSQSLPKMSDILQTDPNITSAGFNAVLGSRLWPKEALTNRTGLLDVFKVLQNSLVEGLVVSGPAVRDQSKAKDVAATSAWRTAYTHMVVASTWGYRNATQEKLIQSLNTNVLSRALRDHAPDSGCYINEADRWQPDAHTAFWSDYERLLKLKRKHDPNGLFWCEPCVGNEDWKLDGKTGKLCKV